MEPLKDLLVDVPKLFEALEKGIRAKDEAAFKGSWLLHGYEKNLVGGSGLEGREVFAQATRKRWVLKPDVQRTQVIDGGTALIVPCQVWAWEKEKAVDKVDLLLVQVHRDYLVLGGGEKRGQVEALASRFLKQEPLDPPEA